MKLLNELKARCRSITPNRKQSCSKIAYVIVVLLLVQVTQISPVASKVLFGGVKHSQSLPAVHYSQHLQGQATQQNLSKPMQGQATQQGLGQPMQGQVAQQGAPATANSITIPKIPKLVLPAPRIEWFMIPKWLAGRWTKKGDQTVSVTNLRTGTTRPTNIWIDDEMTVTWGYQVDKTGTVWHANLLPSWRDSYSNGKYVRFLTTSLISESVNAQRLVTRSHYLVTESTRGHVMQSFQQESVNMYTLGSDGVLTDTSSNRVFTNDGQPVRDGRLSSRFTKVAEFRPRPDERGLNMAESFKQYLIEHGMADRVPGN